MARHSPDKPDNVTQIPKWMRSYVEGDKVGWAQGMAAYADYYCLDGSADDEASVEERLTVFRKPLTGYASRTGTRRNLATLEKAGWRLLLSASGSLSPLDQPFALDNGAWTAFQKDLPFDERAFGRAVEKMGERADWIVVPDIVQGGLKSLEFSLRWLERLKGIPTRLLLAVQDGMQVDDVRSFLSPTVGIFVGGSTDWKETTMLTWGALARRRNAYLHVGRVNSQRRIAICQAAGADSFDGTAVTRFSDAMRPLDAAKRHGDLFPASHIWSDV